MSEINRLQETRRTSITTLIEKYKKLVDDTYDACTKPLPNFTEIQNKDGEIVSTAEEQLFAFIGVRDKALDNANRILIKINDLEIELNAPELLKSSEEKEEGEVKTKNWTKKKAEESK
jgi:hypothetical protein